MDHWELFVIFIFCSIIVIIGIYTVCLLSSSVSKDVRRIVIVHIDSSCLILTIFASPICIVSYLIVCICVISDDCENRPPRLLFHHCHHRYLHSLEYCPPSVSRDVLLHPCCLNHKLIHLRLIFPSLSSSSSALSPVPSLSVSVSSDGSVGKSSSFIFCSIIVIIGIYFCTWNTDTL